MAAQDEDKRQQMEKEQCKSVAMTWGGDSLTKAVFQAMISALLVSRGPAEWALFSELLGTD
jgi:hypothetical protein